MPGKEACVGIRRRIEITAFRRSTIVFRSPPRHRSSHSGSESEPAEPIDTVSGRVNEADPLQPEITSVDDGRSPELSLLIEALVKNDGDSGRAANQLGLSCNDFISKLCGLSFPVK